MNQTHRVSLRRSIIALLKFHNGIFAHSIDKVCDWCDPFVNAGHEWRVK